MSPGSVSTAPETESRRDRQRRELVAEIKSVARQMLSTGGRAGVSWRGIAREVGMNPASLYTYFDTLDDLFTALIVDSSDALADVVAQASIDFADLDPRERSLELALAYRRWALDHRNEYNLLFTDQLPGYAAPPDGPTVDSQRRIFAPFLEAMDAEFDTGLSRDDALEPYEEAVVVSMFGLLHGLVTLEVNHHTDWTSVDREQLLIDQLGAMLDRLDL